jgi:glycosyltransferase involved in cell wall biosynthesis
VRVALLTNILTPYRLPVYRALSAMNGTSWRFFVNAESEINRNWRSDPGDLDVECVRSLSFQRHFAFGGEHARERVTTHVPLGLFESLLRFRPEVVVSAELGPRTFLAWLYCLWTGVPLVIWSYHSRASATAGAPLRALRRFLLARASTVIGMGAQAREVLNALGVENARIFDAPNAHDGDGIDAAIGTSDPEALRAALIARGARERIALIVGRMVDGKGIEALLESWDALPENVREDWSLLFLGDGPLTRQICDAAARSARGALLHDAAVGPERVVDYYLAADLLVFPSLGDPWGLVVNEALACGLPIVCSSRAGCSEELLRDSDCGWVADPLDAAAWKSALHAAITHPDLRSFRPAARRVAGRFGPNTMADGMARAVRAARAAKDGTEPSAAVLLEPPPK